MNVLFQRTKFFSTFSRKGAPKATAVKLNLIHMIVKSHNASDVASVLAHEYSKGIRSAGPRAIIVLLTNICFRLVLHGRDSYKGSKN